MEVSKLTFTKETKEKMNKELSFRERGRLRFKRLKELDESGALSKATNRYEVGRMVGYGEDEDKAAYSWVSNMLSRGHMTETMIGLSPKGRMEFEYHVTGTEPLYCYADKERVKEQLKKEIITEPTPTESLVKLEIAKGDLVIKLELVSETQVIELVKTILKGE